MATTLMPLDPATSPQHTIRVLTIAAHLLPEEVVASRRARRIRDWVIAVLGAFVLLLGGWYAVATYQAGQAADDLAAVTEQSQALQRRQDDYAQVVEVQNKTKAIADQLQTLLANDLQWATLLGTLRSTGTSSGVTVTGVSGALAAADKGATTAPLPPGSRATAVASLTVTGTAADKNAVARYVETLGKEPTFADPYLTSAAETDGKVQFTLQINVTPTALGGRFTSKTSKPGGN